MLDILPEIISRSGIFQYGVVPTADVEFSDEVRKMCEKNTCQQYGKTWACPPAVGTLEECRARAQSFEKMLVFTVKYNIENSFDIEGMMKAMSDFKTVAESLDQELKSHLDNYLILSNESCRICKSCTYPDNPCRFPDRLHASIEGYGIYVYKLAEQAGINYNNGKDTITYFGALLYNE